MRKQWLNMRDEKSSTPSLLQSAFSTPEANKRKREDSFPTSGGTCQTLFQLTPSDNICSTPSEKRSLLMEAKETLRIGADGEPILWVVPGFEEKQSSLQQEPTGDHNRQAVISIEHSPNCPSCLTPHEVIHEIPYTGSSQPMDITPTKSSTPNQDISSEHISNTVVREEPNRFLAVLHSAVTHMKDFFEEHCQPPLSEVLRCDFDARLNRETAEQRDARKEWRKKIYNKYISDSEEKVVQDESTSSSHPVRLHTTESVTRILTV